MSIENVLVDLMKAVDTLAARIDTNSTLQQTANDLRERMVAGQQAAMEKMDGTKAATTRGSRAKAPAPAAEPVADTPVTETPAATETKSFLPAIPTDQAGMKAYIAGWTGETEDAGERAARVQFLKDLATNFGGTGTSALLKDAETAKQSVFYIERKKQGLKVDFNAEYDFDGDPAQGGAGNEEPAADSDDDFG